MARATSNVILVLRQTADKLTQSNAYQWGHMGACNCGFLAQEITGKQKEDIHASAMIGHGDWSDQLHDYCPSGGLPMDEIISEMTQFGFELSDLIHLERLSDPKILSSANMRLRHNLKTDVVKYLRAWAALLENEMITRIKIPDLCPDNKILV